MDISPNIRIMGLLLICCQTLTDNLSGGDMNISGSPALCC